MNLNKRSFNAKNYVMLICFIVFSISCFAQNNLSKQYNLQNIIQLAQETSPNAKIAKIAFQKSYWEYKRFKSDFLPQINANGTIPAFNRSISSVLQPDGSINFLQIQQTRNAGGVNATQRIGLTGGQIRVGSNLLRFDDVINNTTRYNLQPVSVGYTQPILRGNPFKWDKKIAQIRYQVAKKQYNESMEQVAIEANSLFFDVLVSQVSLQIAEKNVTLSDTLYKIASGRYNLGKIAENELLQMKLSKMNSERNQKRSQLNLLNAKSRLLRYLNKDTEEAFSLSQPKEIPNIEFNQDTAFAYAIQNKPRFLSFESDRLQSERNLAQAKAGRRFGADINAGYGLANQGETFNEARSNPTVQQQVSVGVNIPIWNGGKNRSEVKIALAENELALLNLEQNKLNFEQEIRLFLQQFPLAKDQLDIAFESDIIAEKRYDIAVKRYMIGKIGITDLNIALNERNAAKRSLLEEMRSFWDTYYKLRFYTLFDFESNAPIDYEVKVN